MGRAEAAMENQKITVIIEPAEEGGFIAHCPDLPGCITEGETLEEVKAMAEEAVRLYLESLVAHNEPLPTALEEENSEHPELIFNTA